MAPMRVSQAGIFPWSRSNVYQQLDTEKQPMLDSNRSKNSESDDRLNSLAPWKLQSTRRETIVIWLVTIANAAMFGATIFMRWPGEDVNVCVKQTSTYSPIINDRPIEYHDVRFNGTLWPGQSPAWSRREPGDVEAESRWEFYENMPTFPITRDDVISLGKDPQEVARYPDEIFGLGEDAYIGSLDSLHKIHCLNELRKMTFASYGHSNSTAEDHGRLWWVHLRHCVDMLAQDLICHADADVITYRWVDTQDKPFPDFSLNRQCRDFDALIDYQEEHKADTEKYLEMKKPISGVMTVPMEPEYYVAYGFALSEIYPDGKGYDGPWPEQNWFGNPPSSDLVKDRWEGWTVRPVHPR